MEQACWMQLDPVTRGSHCFNLKRSETILLHRNGQRYACFALFRAELKWNKLVARKGTPSRVAKTF